MSTYKLGRHHLRAFLEGTPELVAYVGARPQDTLIYADVANRLFLGKTPFINGAEVARKLGRKPQLAMKDLTTLVQAGVLRHELGASLSVSKAFFSSYQVDKAISGILSQCRAMVAEEDGMVTIHLASASLGIPYKTLWRLIGSGSISRMGVMPCDSFSKGLRIGLSETLSIICGVKNPMLASEVLSFLRVDRKVLRLLVDNGNLVTRPAKPEFKSRLVYAFDRDEVEEFHRTYISLRDVRYRLTPRPSKRALLALGLVPAIALKLNVADDGGAVFFKRIDID